MAIVIPNVGEVAMLTTLVAVTHRYRLFQNNYTPVEGSVVGDFTEATYSGYGGSKEPTYGTPCTVSGTSFVTGGSMFFQHDGGGTSNTIYGYYVTKTDDTTLLFAERFTSSKSMATVADILQLFPRLELA